MGMGDMLVMRGLVAALSAACESVVLVCRRAYVAAVSDLLSDLPNVALLPVVDDAEIVRRFAPNTNTVAEFGRRGYRFMPLGDWARDNWRALDPLWTRALYKHAGVDPELMYSGFRLPPPSPVAQAMLRTVLRITDGKPYVLVHDDPRFLMLLPPACDDHVLHVNDPRFYSDNILDYQLVLRHAARFHCFDSSFAWVVDLGGLGTPTTMHLYARQNTPPHVWRTPMDLLHAPPADGRRCSDMYADPDLGRALWPGRVA
ncbi:MAG: hypothetical protein EBS48_10095 [Actinobacteria bacterium]|nr:hypothetical protein [Actinomycetota bacterium]